MFQKKRPDRRAFAIEQEPHTYVGKPFEDRNQLSVANDNNNLNNNNKSSAAPSLRLGRGKISPPPTWEEIDVVHEQLIRRTRSFSALRGQENKTTTTQKEMEQDQRC